MKLPTYSRMGYNDQRDRKGHVNLIYSYASSPIICGKRQHYLSHAIQTLDEDADIATHGKHTVDPATKCLTASHASPDKTLIR